MTNKIAIAIWFTIVVLAILFLITQVWSIDDESFVVQELDSDIARLGNRQHDIEMNIAQIRVDMTLLQARVDELYAIIGVAKWAAGIAALLGSTIGVTWYERRKHRGGT